MVRRAKKSKSHQTDDASFHKRYDDVERRRLEMLQRLETLNERAHAHAAFKQILKLLNNRFRKASLTHRARILAAAEWMTKLLETMNKTT